MCPGRTVLCHQRRHYRPALIHHHLPSSVTGTDTARRPSVAGARQHRKYAFSGPSRMSDSHAARVAGGGSEPRFS